MSHFQAIFPFHHTQEAKDDFLVQTLVIVKRTGINLANSFRPGLDKGGGGSTSTPSSGFQEDGETGADVQHGGSSSQVFITATALPPAGRDGRLGHEAPVLKGGDDGVALSLEPERTRRYVTEGN